MIERDKMNVIPNMIAQGAFGTFNPYAGGVPSMQPAMGNMIPVGSYGYNPQPQQYYMPQQMQSQQQQNGYVFSPVGGGYNPNPYQPQQQQANYYNPFPQFQQQAITYYPYQQQQPYMQYGYTNYTPFMSLQKQQEMIQMEIEKEKIKARIRARVNGISFTEEELDIRYNPNNKVNIAKREEIQKQRDPIFEEICRVNSIFWNCPALDPKHQTQVNFLNAYYTNCANEFGSHSMFEFFEQDLPKLLEEEWIAENIKPKQNRNLAATYNSDAYNELLNMHRSSNPYVNEILNQSRYDNNIDDAELGLAELFDKERRRINLLTGKLPTFVSSPEAQEARAKWTKEILDIMNKKENKVVSNSV